MRRHSLQNLLLFLGLIICFASPVFAQLSLIHTYSDPALVKGPMCMYEGKLFVSSDRLQIIDIGFPTQPQIIHTTAAEVNRTTHFITVENDIAYIVKSHFTVNKHYVELWNVADPTSPFVIGRSDLISATGLAKIQKIDHHLFWVDSHHLNVIDVSQTNHPVIVYTESHNNTTIPGSFTKYWNHMYYTKGGKIYVCDYSNPPYMTVIDSVSNTYLYRSIFKDPLRPRLYASCYGSSPVSETFDISNPSSLTPLPLLQTPVFGTSTVMAQENMLGSLGYYSNEEYIFTLHNMTETGFVEQGRAILYDDTYGRELAMNRRLVVLRHQVAGGLLTYKFYRVSFFPMDRQEEATLAEVKLFPSLATEVVHIELPNESAVDLSIVNTAGQQVFQQKGSKGKQLSINVQNLAAGLYHVRIQSKTAQTTLKFVKAE